LKISDNLNKLINSQIAHELLNRMKYIQIYSHFEDLQLLKLSKKFKDQADEELGHSQQLIDYLNERLGGKVSVSEIPASDLQLVTLQDVANAYMETELLTTEMIQEIMEAVEVEKSYIDRKFVEEFLHQQIKEEDEADEFMKKTMLVKDILLFDATFGG
jgi:ferritin